MEDDDIRNEDTQDFNEPGQEQHLPHEAWHVVQERRPRRRPEVEEDDDDDDDE